MQRVLGETHETRFGRQWHELTDGERSQLENVTLIGRVNPLNGKHNATHVSRRDYPGAWFTLTLH